MLGSINGRVQVNKSVSCHPLKIERTFSDTTFIQCDWWKMQVCFQATAFRMERKIILAPVELMWPILVLVETN